MQHMKEFLALSSDYVYSIIIPIAIIVFGALVHATAQLKIARDKKLLFTGADFIILFVIAAFSGTIIGMASTIFFDSQTVITLSAGIGAFLGMAGVNAVANAVLSVIVSKIDKQQ